jgi:hypothetical protein
VRDGRVGEVDLDFLEAPRIDALEERLRQHLAPSPTVSGLPGSRDPRWHRPGRAMGWSPTHPS